MDVRAAFRGERTLRRIAALLVALAALAERAATCPPPVRFFVLWLLRQAETAAAEFVFEETGLPLPAVEGFAAEGFGREDALRLAARFHALAALLAALLVAFLHDACHLGRRSDCRSGRRGLASGRILGDWRPMPADTS